MTTIEPSATTPLIRLQGEGESIAFGMTGNSLTLKAAAGETAGRLTVYESVIPVAPGRLPRHLHHQTDELLYVLEGEVTFEVDGQIQQAPTGTFLFIPRGTVHAFANRGPVPARMLTMIVPGGFEGYFRERNAHSEDPAAWEDINRRYDVQIVGPPFDP